MNTERSEEGGQRKKRSLRNHTADRLLGIMAGDDLLTVMQCSPMSQFLSISNQLDRLDGDGELCTEGDAG